MISKNAALFFSLLLIFGFRTSAQDSRAQYPPFLAKSYFSVNVGYMNYPFSNASLEPGFTAESVKVPHPAVRINLLGYRFNEYLSAQVSYMRPVLWVQYKNLNGEQTSNSVYMNVGGLTLKGTLPLAKKVSVYGEGGFALVTRKGFNRNDIPVIKNTTYGSVLLGAGLQYHVNSKWDLTLTSAFSPKNKEEKQPQTTFYSLGFNYNMRPLSKEKVAHNSSSKYIFPRNLLQVGFTPGLGYGVNNFVSKGAIPIFWGGDAEVDKGFSLSYQRNVFHARKVFSLDWGTRISWWKSNVNNEKFFAASIYPVFRFTALRTKPLDLYLNYTVAGPSYISRTLIDGQKTGKKFTFYDAMGMGIYAGKKRNLNAELQIAHYSNGNIFPYNGGVKIPLTFHLGYTFGK